MDKLRAMRFFCRSVESKSFSAAAQSLDVVPSALSKVIATLEAELGFPLLNRSTRGLSLTDGGAVYYEHCGRILRDIEDAEAVGRSGLARVRGVLRLGLHPAFLRPVMRSLGGFLEAHPELRIETIVTNSSSAIVDDGLDLVLHLGQLPDSNLVCRRLGWMQPIVCAAPAYLAQWGVPLHPTDLARHRGIVHARRDEDPNATWTFVRNGETCDVVIPGGVLMRDGMGIIDAAVGGAGIVKLSDIAVHPQIEAGLLREVLSEWRFERKPITAVLPPHSRPAPAKVQMYLDYIAPLLPASGRDRPVRCPVTPGA